MKVLVDTHAYFWWQKNDPRLSAPARDAIADRANEVLVSAVTVWELATKARLGKWPGAETVARDIETTLREHGFTSLPISLQHAQIAGFLLGRHGDPFDRMLAAQSQIEDAPLLTADPAFRGFGTRVLW